MILRWEARKARRQQRGSSSSSESGNEDAECEEEIKRSIANVRIRLPPPPDETPKAKPSPALTPSSIHTPAAKDKRRGKKLVRFDIQGTAKERNAPESNVPRDDTGADSNKAPVKPTGIPTELLVRVFPGRRSVNS